MPVHMDVIPWYTDSSGDESSGYSSDFNLPLVSEGSKLLLQVQVLTLLGSGGFGSVYKGAVGGKTVAIKKLHTATKNERAAAQSLKAEINAMKLDHPNVVKTFGVSSSQLSPDTVIVMEYVGERNLLSVICDPEEEFSFFRRLRYAQHIASGLAYAHSQCVVHLDIKPANILLSPDDTCKVADFGCCQVLERNTGMVSPTNRSYLTGTVAYRAPELLKGGPPSARSDIFSYGVTLWQMMAREIPYGNENQHVVIFGVVAYNLRPKVENKTEEEETALEYCYRDLFESCWESDAEKRPTSKDVEEALDIWLSHII